MCLCEVFLEQEKLRSYAMYFNDKEGSNSMTYREMDMKSDIMASHLPIPGVYLDIFVSLLVYNTFSVIMIVLSIIKSGGAYVTMYPGLPEYRIKYMVEDSGVTILVT